MTMPLKKLKKFDFPAAVRESTYDWTTILDGSIYEMLQGEGKHFDCKPETFATLCRTQAAKRYKKVSISKIENGLVIQATDMTVEERAKEDEKRAEREADKQAETDGAKADASAPVATAPAA